VSLLKYNSKVDIINAPVVSALFKISWPIILSNIFHTLYNITDAFFLGKLGKDELAAPTVAYPIAFVFMSLAIGFSAAGSTMVAQYTGMQKKETAEKAAAQSLLTTAVLSVLFTLPGVIFSRQILQFMGITGNVLELADSYMKIVLLSTPFSFILDLNLGIMRGWGNSFIGLVYTAISVIVNMILDPLLIFTFKLGVLGAAWATFISVVIISFYSIYVMLKGKHGLKLHMHDFRPDLKIIKKVIAIGLPPSLGNSVTSFAFSIIMAIVSGFGPSFISAYGIFDRVNGFIAMFASGIGMAVTTMVGQLLGADMIKKAEDTVKKASTLTFTVVLVFSVLLFFTGDTITRFFINDSEVIAIGKTIFMLVSFSNPFFSVMLIYMGAISGSGHTIQSTFIDVARLWAVRVPLIAFMASAYGINGIFYAMIISNIMALIISLLFYYLGNWRQKVIN